MDIKDPYWYLRDAYDFLDDKDEKQENSARSDTQYLGHWNFDGTIVSPYHHAIKTRKPIWFKDKWYYFVANDSYKQWMMNNNKGGEYLFFSNPQEFSFTPEKSFHNVIQMPSNPSELATVQFENNFGKATLLLTHNVTNENIAYIRRLASQFAGAHKQDSFLKCLKDSIMSSWETRN